MAGKPPFFPFYVKDFVADDLVQAMTTEQVGAYVLLLCAAWQGKPPGSISADDKVLARLVRATDDHWQAELKAGVLSAFSASTDGRYYQKRLRSEYTKFIELSRKRSEAGKRGGRGGTRDAPPDSGKQMLSNCLASVKHAGSGSESASENFEGGSGETFGPTPAAHLSQLFATHYRGLGQEKNPYAMQPTMQDLLDRGISEKEIEAYILADPKDRPRSQKEWQFVKRWEPKNAATNNSGTSVSRIRAEPGKYDNVGQIIDTSPMVESGSGPRNGGASDAKQDRRESA